MEYHKPYHLVRPPSRCLALVTPALPPPLPAAESRRLLNLGSNRIQRQAEGEADREMWGRK